MLTSVSRIKEMLPPAGMLSTLYRVVSTAFTLTFLTSTALSLFSTKENRTVPGSLYTFSRSAVAVRFSTICCVGSVAMMFTRPVAVSISLPVPSSALIVN